MAKYFIYSLTLFTLQYYRQYLNSSHGDITSIFQFLERKGDSRSILGFNKFCDSVQLNVGGALINGANFAISEKLFDRIVFSKSNTTHPLYTFRSRQSCHLCKRNGSFKKQIENEKLQRKYQRKNI